MDCRFALANKLSCLSQTATSCHVYLLTCNVFVASGWVHEASLQGVTIADVGEHSAPMSAIPVLLTVLLQSDVRSSNRLHISG
jgi:hypothetical protein